MQFFSSADAGTRIGEAIGSVVAGAVIGLIVYVTHFLTAVLEVCDRLTILRDGTHVRTGPTAAETEESIVEGMLGRATDVSFTAPEPLAEADRRRSWSSATSVADGRCATCR